MENNENQIEKEYLALLINKPDLLGLVQINPKYLQIEENKILFEQLLWCYQTYKTITVPKICEKYKNFNTDYYTSILTEVYFSASDWKKQLEYAEETILNNFKKRYSQKLILDYQNKKLEYQELLKSLTKLDQYKLSNAVKPLTREKIDLAIADKNQIEIKCFPKLNELLKLVQNDFVVVGAMTGHGKSSFLLNLMNDLMGRYQCILFNMENSESTTYKRMLSIASNVPVKYINNAATDYQAGLIESGYQKVLESEVIVNHLAYDIEEIKKVIAINKDLKKHTIVFLDHIGIIKINNRKSIYESSTEIAKALRQICLEYDCTIVSASQLNRNAYREEINLSQLKDSGEIENSASKVILLHQFEDDQLITKLDIEIAKNRDGETGLLKMEYDKSKQIFKELKDK